MTRTYTAGLGFFWSIIGTLIVAVEPTGPGEYSGFVYMFCGSLLLSAAAISKRIPGEGK